MAAMRYCNPILHSFDLHLIRNPSLFLSVFCLHLLLAFSLHYFLADPTEQISIFGFSAKTPEIKATNPRFPILSFPLPFKISCFSPPKNGKENMLAPKEQRLPQLANVISSSDFVHDMRESQTTIWPVKNLWVYSREDEPIVLSTTLSFIQSIAH